MKAETYMTSRRGGIEYGFQLTSDDGDFIMDMVLGDSFMPLMSARKDIETQFVKHRPLITMMAEAPNLLAALEHAMEMIEHVVEDGYYYEGSHEIINEAKEAIAKAKEEPDEEDEHE